MADDVKADEYTDLLRAQFARSISKGVAGIPAHHALQLADALCAIQADVLAGKRVSFRAAPKIDGEAITEAWQRGRSIAEIVQTFRVSQSTAYKYHPNRLQQRSG